MALPSVFNSKTALDIALFNQIFENAIEALLGDPQNFKKFCDGQSRIAINKMHNAMMRATKAIIFKQAVRIANDSPYGLAGAVWSGSDERAQKVARRIRAGQIDVNGGAFNMNAPFGGFKQSGHGREAGTYGLEEFLEYKSLQLKG